MNHIASPPPCGSAEKLTLGSGAGAVGVGAGDAGTDGENTWSAALSRLAFLDLVPAPRGAAGGE